MKTIRAALWSQVGVLTLLSACGGGGSTPAPEGRVSASASVAEVKGDYDAPVEFRVSVRNSGEIPVTNITVTPAGGALQAQSNGCSAIVLSPGQSCELGYRTAATAAGQGSYAFDIKFSHDGQVRQTHLALPFNLGASQWSTLGAWATYQGNASHTGYVPVTLDTSKFKKAWDVLPDAGAVTTTVAASDRNLAYVTTGGRFAEQRVVALSLGDGSARWSFALGNLHGAFAPAIDGEDLFLASSGHSDTFLWKFNARTGELKARTAFGSQWESYLAPVIWDQQVYFNCGSYGGLCGYKRSDATEVYFKSLNQYDGWSPAVDAKYVYAYTGSYQPKLSVFNRVTGDLAYEVPDPNFNWTGWTMESSPVLNEDSTRLYAVQAGRMLAFDLDKRAIAWEQRGNFYGQPAYADRQIFVRSQNASQLTVLDATTGAPTWIWALPRDSSSLAHEPIVTRSHVFLSSESKVYAVRRSDHALDWTYPVGGKMALSNAGKLLITSTGGRVTAIDLR